MEIVLVTGGAGFIGSHTCKALEAAGFLPIAFDDLSKGYAEFVRWDPLAG
jgi:UDP-glucose 4-epimerase